MGRIYSQAQTPFQGVGQWHTRRGERAAFERRLSGTGSSAVAPPARGAAGGTLASRRVRISNQLADPANAHKLSTLYRRLSGISRAHQAAGDQTPTKDAEVRLVFQGIRRILGSTPDQKNPAITAEVRAMVETLKLETRSGVRDRALLLIGFAGAFRRSELVSLDVGDITSSPDGLVIQLRRSKTDQEGQGRKVGLPFGSNPLICPVRALRDWLDCASISRGPIFRPIDRQATSSRGG